LQKDLRFPSFFYKQRLNAVGIPMLCGVLLFLLLGKGFSAFAFSAAIVFVVLAFFQKGERGQIFLCAAIGIALSMLVCGAYSLQQNKAKSLSGFSHSAEGTVVLVGEDSFDLALSEFDEKFSLLCFAAKGSAPIKWAIVFSWRGKCRILFPILIGKMAFFFIAKSFAPNIGERISFSLL
jgi:hypothetical protein